MLVPTVITRALLVLQVDSHNRVRGMITRSDLQAERLEHLAQSTKATTDV